jgi:hypothetical protein
VIAGGVELEGGTGDEQDGRFRIVCSCLRANGGSRPVPDHAAEVGEGVAQVAEGVPIRPLGPQEPGQHLAAVRSVRLDGQIGQQGPLLVRFEARHRLPVQCHLEGPQQGKRQVCHPSSLEKARSNSALTDHYTLKKEISQPPRFGHVPATFSPPLFAILSVKAAHREPSKSLESQTGRENDRMYAQMCAPEVRGLSYGHGLDQQRQGQLKLYQRARDRSRRDQFWSRLTGRPRCLLDLASVEANCRVQARRDAGVWKVSIDQIRGSESRARDFGPLRDDNRERWLGIAAARQQGKALPPVVLIEVGGIYFVLDGHHRVSVAQALGQQAIEAKVVKWQVEGSLPWET